MPARYPNEPYISSTSFNRPADTTAYSAGDLIANVTTTSPQITPLTWLVSFNNDDLVAISRFKLRTNDAAFAGKQVNLWLFESLPVLGVGDNGALASGAQVSESDFIDKIAFTLGSTAFSDGWITGFAVPSISSLLIARPVSGGKTLFGILESVGAVTPGSGKTWTARLEIAERF